MYSKQSFLSLLIFAVILFGSSGLAEESRETGSVPAALKADCKWERRDDYKKPWTVMFGYQAFKGFTELKCKKECDQSTICGYANFNNRTRQCQLIPRRAFHQSYLSNQGLYVMWEKNCPLEHIWNRTDDPTRMVMCRMESRKKQRLSPKYAYKVAKYLDDERDAQWWCQLDPLCKGIYKNSTAYLHVFLYKAVVDNTAVGTISQVNVKSCVPPPSGCLFTAFNRMEVIGKPYKQEYYKIFRDCFALCEKDPECFAASSAEDSWRRGPRACKLYREESVEALSTFTREFDNAKAWLRNACHP